MVICSRAHAYYKNMLVQFTLDISIPLGGSCSSSEIILMTRGDFNVNGSFGRPEVMLVSSMLKFRIRTINSSNVIFLIPISPCGPN